MVQPGFYLLSVIAVGMIAHMLTVTSQGGKVILRLAVFVALWSAYIFFLHRTGVLADFSLPPRVPLLIVVPAMVISIVITGRSSFRRILEKTPLQFPLYLQSFRVAVELLIYGAFAEGVFPRAVTFEGTNFDVLSGLSAPVVAYLYQHRKVRYSALLIWNIVAILTLGVTVYSFVSAYYFASGFSGSADFVTFPYLLLPAVLLPVAVFLHIFSLRQIILRRRVDLLSDARALPEREAVS